MASLYPGGFDVLVNPLPGDPLTAPSHAANHTAANDAVEAIQATLGLNPQGASATVAARLATLSGAAIGGAITGATTGSVLFVGALGVLQQDNANFFWNDTNNGLGVGAAPGTQDRLHIRFTGNAGDPANELRVSRAPGTAGEANEWTVGISHPTVAVATGSLLFRPSQTAPLGTPSDIGFLASSVAAGTDPDLIIKASGRVGIGTPSPAAQLHVVNTLGIRVEETGATTRNLTLTPPTIGARGSILGNSGNGLAVGVDAAGPLVLRTNSADRVTIDSAGLVTLTNGLTIPGTVANPFTINTKVYSFPSTAFVVGGALTDVAGNGVLTWVVPSGGGGGVTTMAAIGAAPNANSATIAGVTLNLEPASASFGGVVTTGTQTFAGAKTFSGSITASAAVTIPGTLASPFTINTKAFNFPAAFGAPGSVLTDAAGNGTLSWAAVGAGSGVTTMAAIGVAPNANAATIAGVTLTMQPASVGFGGVVTTGTQTFAGTKTFSGDVTASGSFTIPGTLLSPFTINTKAFNFPAAFGAAGSVLTDAAGNGTLSWTAAGGGVTTMAPIGVVPNANAASISGATLTMQPASVGFGGVVTTGTQTFAGAKGFSGKVTLTNALDIPGTVANPFTINTKIYSFPAAFGAAGSQLTDAAGDGVLSWAASTSMAIGGAITSATQGSVLFAGVGGILQQDNANFFWDDTNNRLGIKTNAPAHLVDIVAGALGQGKRAINLTGTLASGGTVTEVGFDLQITSNGSQTHPQLALRADLLAGYTGLSGTTTVFATNEAAGTSTSPLTNGGGNKGGLFQTSTLATTGHNVGVWADGAGSTVRNFGVIAKATAAGAIEAIGAYGTSGGASTKSVGGMFTLYGGTDSFSVPAGGGALIADNGTTSKAIFRALSNATEAFSIDGSGVTVIGGIDALDTGIGKFSSLATQGPLLLAQTASTEIISYGFNYAGNINTMEYAAGALAKQRTLAVVQQTYKFVSASTITNAATVAITGAPVAGTNATITNRFALWVESGDTKLNDAVRRPNFDKDALYQANFVDEMVRSTGLAIDSKEEWDATSTGTVSTQGSVPAAGLDNDFGMMSMTTGFAVDSGIQYMLGLNTGITPNTGQMVARARVRFPTLSSALQEFVFRFGFSDATTQTNASDYAVFEYDRLTAGSDAWRTHTGNDGITAATLESAIAANTWYDLRIVWDDTTASVAYFLNNVLVNTQTGTSVPTSADDFGVILQIYKTAGTTSRTTIIDYVTFNNFFNTPRG